MARLYSNENFPVPVVERLRLMGHDVLTSQEAGRASQCIPDEEVLRFAIEQQRAILTLNRRHFVSLHQNVNGAHYGVIVCHVDPDFGRFASNVHQMIESTGNDLARKLIRVNRKE
jgi:hypothetical protein